MNPPHSHSLHWGHGTAAPATTWGTVGGGGQSQPARVVKRPVSISGSDDCEDAYSEECSKDQCTSPGNADSCQMLSRKKRRGVIEKKRRDRINTSLSELKRLVPGALEKQGSAKLEKAEILQMTVEHLKMIQAKGLDVLAYDPHKFAMDYHSIGVRECATEISRYLSVEGLDIHDPLRLRIMSHIQCFAAQRELAIKQATTVSPWGYTTSQNYTTPLNPPSTSIVPNLPHQLGHYSNVQDLNPHFDISTSCAQSIVSAVPSTNASPRQSSSPSVLTPLTPVSSVPTTASSAFGYHQYSNLNSFSNQHPNYNQGNNSPQMKPYRPWGRVDPEVAY